MSLDAAALESARLDLGLSVQELWVRCLGLGGLLTQGSLSHSLLGEERLTAREYDIVAQALNEEFLGMGGDHPVAYANED